MKVALHLHAVTHTRLCRFGEQNGRAKLKKSQVIKMRILRQQEQINYTRLGQMFKVHPKHAKKICTGHRWPNAGGPIESPEPDEELPLRFDTTTVIRCQSCRHRAHPSLDDPTRCALCVRRGARLHSVAGHA